MRGSGWHLELYCDISICKVHLWPSDPFHQSILALDNGRRSGVRFAAMIPATSLTVKTLVRANGTACKSCKTQDLQSGAPQGDLSAHKLIQRIQGIQLRVVRVREFSLMLCCPSITLGHTFGCQSRGYLQGNDSACSHMLFHHVSPLPALPPGPL